MLPSPFSPRRKKKFFFAKNNRKQNQEEKKNPIIFSVQRVCPRLSKQSVRREHAESVRMINIAQRLLKREVDGAHWLTLCGGEVVWKGEARAACADSSVCLIPNSSPSAAPKVQSPPFQRSEIKLTSPLSLSLSMRIAYEKN